MLDFSGLNYGALIVAWLVNVGVGSFWYSPAGFGKLWSKLSGVDMMKLPKSAANKAIGAVMASALVQTFVLGVILHSLHASGVGSGVQIGLLVWAGFTAATSVGTSLYTRFGWKFWWLNSSFFLVVMAVNSAIITLWK